MLAVFFCVMGLMYWGLGAAYRKAKERFKGVSPDHPINWKYYSPRIKMTVGLVLFWLYPQVSRSDGGLPSAAVAARC